MHGSILEESDTLMSIEVRSLKTCIAWRNPLGCRGSACVEVMSTLHRSAPSLRRRAEGCVPPEGSQLSLEPYHWRRVGGRLIRADSYPSSDSSVEMSDELASTLASIQEFMVGISRRLDQIESSRQDHHPVGISTDDTIPHVPQTAQVFPLGTSHGVPFHLSDHCETAPPPAVTVSPPRVPTIEDTRLAEQEAKVERLESMMRQIRLQDEGLTWDDRDGIPAASLPSKFRMPNIELGGPLPMSLSGAAQRWFASIKPSRLRTWRDVAHEFLTQFTFSTDIDVSRRELEATRQRLDESISSFVTRWRAKDLKSLVQASFSVEEAIARGLWTDATLSPDSKKKKPIGSFSRSGEYQSDYDQEPYIAQTSMQPRPPHPRAATHPPPRPYA
ncbi:hypothetical protein CK203_066105 [Vitis vinifera]|uniref:Retrotransposon gag domain-containing protein n=1 Tax=Vitis vinifera TaxID=29760 RepID=A0A438G4C9_VITVI|nr:hypothetical protein CK203_066105 [Vitis vinifera]